MKPRISPFELTILMANFAMAATLISLPQALVQVGQQNTWMVPIIVFPLFLAIIILLLRKKAVSQEKFQRIFDINKSKFISKAFVAVLSLFLILIFIRDLRALIDFVSVSLLSRTPIEVICVLSVVTLVYITWSGIEVIARMTVVLFLVFAGIVFCLPLLLANEFQISNIQPVLGADALPSILQSTYLILPWIGEVIILLVFLMYVNPFEKSRKASIIGVSLGLLVLFVLLLSEIAVLGTGIIMVSTFPNYQLIQQINITDFLDRLDLVIVIFWIPTLFCKLALSLYCVNKTVCYFTKQQSTNVFILPISIILGVLSIILFKNNIHHLEFSFFTWATLGILFELIIIFMFLFITRFHLKVKTSQKGG